MTIDCDNRMTRGTIKEAYELLSSGRYIGGFVDQRAMEDVATAKKIKAYGRRHGKKYTRLKKNYLLNSTRKYDDNGDWLYFKLLVKNAGAIVKMLFGNTKEYDRLIDDMFYDYNDKSC